MNIGVCGIGGRMGRAILTILLERGHSLTAAFDADGSPFMGKKAGEIIGNPAIAVDVTAVTDDAVRETDGILDFSSPKGTLGLLDFAVRHGKPLVIGTTGFSDDERNLIEKASKAVPVVLSPNMSMGVNLLFKLTGTAARALPGYDVEIFEAHHRFKKDAPSGTAKKLIETVKGSMESLSDADEVHGRDGITGERRTDEIGVMAMRGGDIVGEHTVFFAGMGERIELTHRAQSREPLARGAVKAMEFLNGRGPGLYSMFDVLGFA